MADDDDDSSQLCVDPEEQKFQPPEIVEVLSFKCDPTKEQKVCKGGWSPWFEGLEGRQNGVRDSGYSFGLLKFDVKAVANRFTFNASGGLAEAGGEPTGSLSTKYVFESVPGLSVTERWKQDNTLGVNIAFDDICDAYTFALDSSYQPTEDVKEFGVKLGYRIPNAAIKLDGSSTGAAGGSIVLGSDPFFIGARVAMDAEQQTEKRVVAAFMKSCWGLGLSWSDGEPKGEGERSGSTLGSSVWKRFCNGLETAVFVGKEDGSDSPSWAVATKYPVADAGVARVRFDSDKLLAIAWQLFIHPSIAFTLSVRVDTNDLDGGNHAAGCAIEFNLK